MFVFSIAYYQKIASNNSFDGLLLLMTFGEASKQILFNDQGDIIFVQPLTP
jgi:hypothetical protein